MIRENIRAFGLEIGELVHERDPVDVENQPIIRMNADTLYSSLVLDLSEPVEVTMPDIGGRYQSMHVMNQDHFSFVEATPGTYTLNEDVPVDAFRSVTVYNADGYMEATGKRRTNYNNITVDPNADGSITIHFGGCDDGRVNCIPISPGWNYTVRLYQPRAEVLDGSWTFPPIEPVD